MAVPGYHYLVQATSRQPMRGALSVNNTPYDVYYGAFGNMRKWLGQDNKLQIAHTENEVMRHFTQADPYTKVSIYNAIFGEIYTLQKHQDGFHVVAKRSINSNDHGSNEDTEDSDSGSINLRNPQFSLDTKSEASTYQAIGRILSQQGLFADKSAITKLMQSNGASENGQDQSGIRRSQWGKK